MNLDLFVADDIRLEADGKVMLIGMYPNRILVAIPSNPAVAETAVKLIPRLSLLAYISDTPPGTFELRVLVLDPDGQPIPEDVGTMQLVVVMPRTNIILNFAPFTFRKHGRHQLSLTFAGETLIGNFGITLDPDGILT